MYGFTGYGMSAYGGSLQQGTAPEPPDTGPAIRGAHAVITPIHERQATLTSTNTRRATLT